MATPIPPAPQVPEQVLLTWRFRIPLQNVDDVVALVRAHAPASARVEGARQ